MSQKESDSDDRKPSIILWLAAVSSLCMAMCMGTVLGWSSPALPSMESNSSRPHINGSLSDDDKQIKTWIGSSTTLGALCGGLSAGTIVGYLGMKKSLTALGIPIVVGWVLILVAKSSGLIIGGRVLMGISVGIGSGIAPTYIANIATPGNKGLLGTGFQLFVNVGILYTYLWGLGFQNIDEEWRWLCFPAMAPAILMSIGMFFMPDSPQWLMNKFGRGSQVVDSLRRLRSSESDIDGELKELEERANKAKQEPSFSLAMIKRADVFKPLIIANALMFFQQFSGINAVLFYATSIFKDAGSSIDPLVSTVIIALVLTLSVIAAAFLIERLGRKILLIASGIGMAISLVMMGYYYYDTEVIHKPDSPSKDTVTTTVATATTSALTAVTSSIGSTIESSLSTLNSTVAPTAAAKTSSLGWLPVLSLVIYVIMFSVGIGPIPWMMATEITPSFALGFISSIATAMNWGCAFIITKEFDDITKAMKSYGVFWMFAGLCLAEALFTLLFVPESKGKSIEEIQRIFCGDKHIETMSNGRYDNNNSKDVSAI